MITAISKVAGGVASQERAGRFPAFKAGVEAGEIVRTQQAVPPIGGGDVGDLRRQPA